MKSAEERYNNDPKYRYFVHKIEHIVAKEAHELKFTPLEAKEAAALAGIKNEMRQDINYSGSYPDLYIDRHFMDKHARGEATEEEKKQIDKEYQEIISTTKSTAVKKCLGAYCDLMKSGSIERGSLRGYALDLECAETYEKAVK